MADDQAKFDLKIGLQVEGGDSAAQRIAALTKQIGGLERQASQMRGLANIPIQMQDLIRSSYKTAQGFGAARDQAKSLKPAITAIGEAIKKTGLSQDVLKGVGLDDASLRAAGKNAAGFRGLIENLAKARAKAISAGAEYSGKAESLAAERSLLTTNFNREQRLREEAAKKAVATDKATEAQKTQAAMAGARERIAVAKQAATSVSDAGTKDLTPRRFRAGGRFSESELAAQAKRLAPYEAEYQAIKDAQARKAAAAASAAAKPVAAAAPPATARGAISGLDGLAAAAKNASAALNAFAKSASSAGRSGKSNELVATRMMREMRGGFAKEYAMLHRSERRNEAQQFPKSPYAGGQMAAQPAAASKAYNQLSAAAQGASRSISGVVQEGDAITGQIKNVLGMAFGYQAIHAVASQLQQVFGHLQGGVIQFNSMLEQATVGFTTLFDNQRKQAEATNELLGEQKVGVDFISMGYNSAEEAAQGTINTIKQFANVTPFRFAELQEATLRMRAFGFDMSEILRENTEAQDKFSGGVVAVGNAVAALGGGADAFRRITYALGQMKQAGRVYQNDMMQLANAGIGGYKYIAEALMKEITTDQSGQRSKVIKGQERLYSELEKNAIETVRRLTTRGQISGEVASRAILAGLERDFGGGMMAQSKTFAGAFSTVADMSQSLVADAFRPLYNAIRDITYEFSQFLQNPKVAEAAKDFSRVVQGIVRALAPMGVLLMQIGQKIAADFGAAISSIGSKTSEAGKLVGGTFGAFMIGIRELIKLLDNDYARSVIAAAAVTKIAFAFGAANPFLSQLILIISAVGALKFAINENILGVGDAFRKIAGSLEPLIGTFRDKLLPTLTKIGESITVGFVAGLSATLIAIQPIISAFADALMTISDIFVGMDGPLRAIGFLLGVSLASKIIVGGVNLLTGALTRAAVQMALLKTNTGLAVTNMQKLAAFGNTLVGVGIVGTMGVQAAEGAGVLDEQQASIGQAIFSLVTFFGMLAMIIGPLIAFITKFAGAIGGLLARLGPVVGIIGRIVLAVGGFVATLLGVSTGVGVAVVAIGSLIAAILGFAIFSEKKPEDPTKPPVSRYDYTQGTVLQGSGYYKDPLMDRAIVDFRKMERESRYPRVIQNAKNEMKDLTNYQKLLINQQDAANTSTEKYNGLLNIAKQRVQDALGVLRKVAEAVLDDIMNPQFESPYAPDEGDLISYEKMLEMEQEMSFLTFENRQGINRSFGEYKDVLGSILPLSEDEVNSGEISLKMVRERLKIDKERRKEQERIKALAEAEYDLGLATLQQYDESIDPLTRAINLRSAQSKYEKDIADLRIQGLENLVDEAENSRDWDRVTAATKKRLEDWKAGQELILDEMRNMFEDYNRDIAWILENPSLSAEEKKTRIETRLEELKGELESKFGITLKMMDDKVGEMNSQMQLVMDAANMKGIDMNVTFADSLINNLETKGFKALTDYLMKKYRQVVDLMGKIKAAAADAAAAASEDNLLAQVRSKYLLGVQNAITALYRRGEASETINQVKAFKTLLLGKNTVADLQNAWNSQISPFLTGLGLKKADIGFARGGVMPARRLALVGEKGPELVLPQQSGLVLNNSISSRLLGMLTGKGGGGGNNVTINVNNPVIRNDNDIRKLAQEISRVQASQFRTEGGRL
jgi:hypothetical protein